MDFQAASKGYLELSNLLAKKELTEKQFAEEVARLKVQDSSGSWWQVNHADGSWLKWSGSRWEKAAPPAAQRSPLPPSQAGPQSLRDLFVFLAKVLVNNAPKILLQAVVVGIIVWIAHAYFLIVVNNGYLKVGSWAANIVALDLHNFNNVPYATFLWAVIGWSLSFLIFNRMIGKGPLNYAKDLFYTPLFISKGFQQNSGRVSFALFFCTAAVSLVANVLLDNIYLSAVIALALIIALTARFEGLSLLILKLGYSDLQKLFSRGKPARPLNEALLLVIICSIIFGILFLLILPFKPYSAYLAAGLFLGAGIVFIARPKTSMTNVFLVLFFTATIYLLFTEGVLAHDGGWDEYGRNFGNWWRGAGRNEALAAGNRPAVGAIVASILSAMGLHISQFSRLDPEMRASLIAEAYEELAGRSPEEVQEISRQRMQDHHRRTEAEHAYTYRDQRFWDWTTWGVEWLQYGCDTGVEVLAVVTGPVGQGVRRIYRIASPLAEGVGEAAAAAPGERGEHLAVGVGRAAGSYIGGSIKNERLRRGFEIVKEGAAGGWQRGREAVREGEDVMSAVSLGFVEGSARQTSRMISKDIKNPFTRFYYNWGEGMARGGYRAYIDGKDAEGIRAGIRRGARDVVADEAIKFGTEQTIGQMFDRFVPESGALTPEAMQQQVWNILTQDGNNDQLVSLVQGDWKDWASDVVKDEIRSRVREGVIKRGENLIKTGSISL